MEFIKHFLCATAVLCTAFLFASCSVIDKNNFSVQLPSFSSLVPYEKAESLQLGVENILQDPELPNGCEATSLTAVLRYFGYDADKLEIAEEYLPTEDFSIETSATTYTYRGKRYAKQIYICYGPDPHVAFAGNPADDTYAYYCFSEPLAEAANAYLAAQDSENTALDITGADRNALLFWMRTGRPVVVWCTLQMHTPWFSGFTWILPSGERYEAYGNVHCVVLSGFNEGQDTFHIVDPIDGAYDVTQETFLACYEALGSNAIVLDAEHVNTGEPVL